MNYFIIITTQNGLKLFVFLSILLSTMSLFAQDQDTIKVEMPKQETIVRFGDAEENVKYREQTNDKIRFGSAVTFGILPLTISGTTNLGTIQKPNSVWSDTLGIAISVLAGLSLYLPIIKNKKQSFGINLNALAGYQLGVVALDGWKSHSFDFPQYIYYRQEKKNFDYSILLGYKYCISPVNYKMPIAAFQINDIKMGGDSVLSIGIYGGILSDKYYHYLSNNTFKTALIIREFGVNVIKIF